MPNSEPVKEPVNEPVLICAELLTAPVGSKLVICAELETTPPLKACGGILPLLINTPVSLVIAIYNL